MQVLTGHISLGQKLVNVLLSCFPLFITELIWISLNFPPLLRGERRFEKPLRREVGRPGFEESAGPVGPGRKEYTRADSDNWRTLREEQDEDEGEPGSSWRITGPRRDGMRNTNIYVFNSAASNSCVVKMRAIHEKRHSPHLFSFLKCRMGKPHNLGMILFTSMEGLLLLAWISYSLSRNKGNLSLFNNGLHNEIKVCSPLRMTNIEHIKRWLN